MRPSKRVLIVDADENRRSIMAYTVRHQFCAFGTFFKADTCDDCAIAMRALDKFRPEALLIVGDHRIKSVLLLTAAASERGINTVELPMKDNVPLTETEFGVTRIWGTPSTGTIVEALRTACARKRGPRKLPQRAGTFTG
jgi:hypothetical protein